MQANGKSIRVGFVEVLRDVKGRQVGAVAETAQAASEDRGDQAMPILGSELEIGIVIVINAKRRRWHGVLLVGETQLPPPRVRLAEMVNQ
jgi:hypothetical protein